MENQRVLVCCDMILEKKGKILLGKRGEKAFGTGSWALPGGHLERGENSETCMARELLEEIGIVPVTMKLLFLLNDIQGEGDANKQYMRFVYHIPEFIGTISNPEPDRCESWQWFDKENLPAPLFIGHAKLLSLFLDGTGPTEKIEYVEM